MNERETHDILTYLFADLGLEVRPEKRRVWHDQFRHVDVEVAFAAARLLVCRKIYGQPRVHDFIEALADITASAEESFSWGEAWDLWVTTARRIGFYERGKASEYMRARCPIGFSALGTSIIEYWSLKTEDLGTYRAQFRQRFEILHQRARAMRTLSPDIRKMLEHSNSIEYLSHRGDGTAKGFYQETTTELMKSFDREMIADWIEPDAKR